MSIEFHCPSCDKKLFTYEERTRKYGKLLKECKKCGAQYSMIIMTKQMSMSFKICKHDFQKKRNEQKIKSNSFIFYSFTANC